MVALHRTMVCSHRAVPSIPAHTAVTGRRESILQLVAAIYSAVSSAFTATPIRNGWHCTYLVRSYRAAIRSHYLRVQLGRWCRESILQRAVGSYCAAAHGNLNCMALHEPLACSHRAVPIDRIPAIYSLVTGDPSIAGCW
jgi:hypothetical protein